MGVAPSVILLLALVVIFVNEYYQARLGVPCMPTMPAVRKKMLELAANPGQHIVEIGSGWGGMTLAAARLYPQSRVTGIEFSLFPYLFSRLRLLCSPAVKNVTFLRRDFFAFPMTGATTLLCYLTNPLMAKLGPKLRIELPEGARVVSSTFHIPDWVPDSIAVVPGKWDTKIFVYTQQAAA